MGPEAYSGITRFASFWSDAPMVQHTYDAFTREADAESDAVIDAAKGMVECAYRTIIFAIQGDHVGILARTSSTPSLEQLHTEAVKVLKLADTRDPSFNKLLNSLHCVGGALAELRNKAGPLSHGKDGFIEAASPSLRLSAVLAADTLVTFLQDAFLELEVNINNTALPYETFVHENKIIDTQGAWDVEVGAGPEGEEAIVLSAFGGISIAVPLSKFLFDNDREAYGELLSLLKESHSDTEDKT